MGSPGFLRILSKGTIAIEKNGTLYSMITDYRGSVAVVMDSSGPIAPYEYGAFGEELQEGIFSSPWQFCSQRKDPETGLLHFLKRIYDPDIGSWLTPDPAGFVDGPNIFAYVNNNPLRYIDPLGLSKEEQSVADRGFAYHFSRGFIDDTTMGVSSYFMGEHRTPTFSANAAYYTGVASLLACGLVYGGAYLKGARLGGRALAKGWNAGKYLFRGGKAADRTLKGRRVLNLSSIAKWEMLQGKQIWSSTKQRTPVKNAYYHWKKHGIEFPELQSANQYVEQAHNFFRDPKALSRVRSDGALLRYDLKTNRFGSFTPEGIPKIFLNPNPSRYPYATNLEYFHGQ